METGIFVAIVILVAVLCFAGGIYFIRKQIIFGGPEFKFLKGIQPVLLRNSYAMVGGMLLLLGTSISAVLLVGLTG